MPTVLSGVKLMVLKKKHRKFSASHYLYMLSVVPVSAPSAVMAFVFVMAVPPFFIYVYSFRMPGRHPSSSRMLLNNT